MDDDVTDKPISHAGELEMRRRLPSRHRMNEEKLAKMVSSQIDAKLTGFIERQSFFFIATSSDIGDCDANFRGRDSGATGRPEPLLKVTSPTELIFPDFAGNGFYNSLGNIQLNPHIGMLFMDFQEQERARVNGKAFIDQPDSKTAEHWPKAQAIIRVQVEQAYYNCTARIPKMKMFTNSNKVVRLGRSR